MTKGVSAEQGRTNLSAAVWHSLHLPRQTHHSRDHSQLCVTRSAGLERAVVRRDNSGAVARPIRSDVLRTTRENLQAIQLIFSGNTTTGSRRRQGPIICSVVAKPDVHPECRHGWLRTSDSSVSGRTKPLGAKLRSGFSPVSASANLRSGVLNSDSLHAPKSTPSSLQNPFGRHGHHDRLQLYP